MEINVKEASIKTASVEIKALTVSGKQVTLAVFRQLKRADLIIVKSREIVWNGVPWGQVNYHVPECKDFGTPHVHIVWQYGAELYHDIIGDVGRSTQWELLGDSRYWVLMKYDDAGTQLSLDEMNAIWVPMYRQLLDTDHLFIAV